MLGKLFRRNSSQIDRTSDTQVSYSYPSSRFAPVFSTDRCEKCDVTGIPILYGMPNREAELAAERGELVFGGCRVYGGEPRFECPNCQVQWRTVRSKPY